MSLRISFLPELRFLGFCRRSGRWNGLDFSSPAALNWTGLWAIAPNPASPLRSGWKRPLRAKFAWRNRVMLRVCAPDLSRWGHVSRASPAQCPRFVGVELLFAQSGALLE